MSSPYRVAAAPEPDEPEGEEPYAALLRAQQRRARMFLSFAASVLTATIAAAVARPAPAEPDGAAETARRREARRTRARDAIASARGRAAAMQSRFADDVRAAVTAGVAPRDGTEACPIRIAAPTGLARGRAFPLVVVTRADVDAANVPSRAIADVLADVSRAEEHLAAGRYEEATLYADALEHPGRLVFDVVLVASKDEKPSVTSDLSFVPGDIEGRAYLYEFASRRVVCAADVRAKSSNAIGYAYSIGIADDAPPAAGRAASMKDAVDLDMEMQIERAVALGMRPTR